MAGFLMPSLHNHVPRNVPDGPGTNVPEGPGWGLGLELREPARDDRA